MTVKDQINRTIADLVVFMILTAGVVYVIGYFLGIWEDAPIW